MASPDEFTNWLLDTWTARLAGVVESMAGEAPAITWQASELRRAGPGVLWWQQLFSLSREAALWVGAAEPTWTELGGRVLRSAGIEPVEAADARNTYLEIISQALSGCAQAIGSQKGEPVSCQEGSECTRPPETAAGFECTLSIGEQTLPLWVGIGPGLAGAVETGVAERPDSEALPALPEAPEPAESVELAEPVPPAKSMDVLLDVELPVSVSFGRAQLPLKEVLKLTTGSIVELNRAISEPVEVIVNNCVIARGEVVVVEGNYGVRIHEILSRDKRLRTLS
jgi:flagellar motor switch protein FliN/FliY